MEVVAKLAGIWLPGGGPRAIRRGVAFPISAGFSVFPPKIEMMKKHEKTVFFEILIGIVMPGGLLGANGGSFSGTPNFEKRNFPKKC